MFKNKNQKKKALLIILLIAIPTSMLFGFLIPNGKADEDIPEDPYINPYNEWHWNVSVDDRLMYEVEYTFQSLLEPNMVFPVKDIVILDIDFFKNDTEDFMGPTEMSSIFVWEKFYNNDTGDLENKYADQYEIAKFGFDPDGYYKEKYGINEWIIPIILPINGTKNFEADVMADILQNTGFGPAADRGDFNEFDEYGSDPGENKIWFKNNDEGYYLNATYYDNGTLIEGIGKFAMRTESDELDAVFTARYKRVFDYNVTDEIEWGVKAGDTFYMGMAYSGEEFFFNETKIDIVGIFKEYIEIPSMFDGNGGYPLEFDIVIANVSLWDHEAGEYVLALENMVVGVANNFYPQYYPLMFGGGGDGNGNGGGDVLMIVIPNNTKQEDLSFWWNNITCFRYYYSEAHVTDTSVELTSFFPGLRANWIFDDNTGLAKMLYSTIIGGDGDGNGDGPIFSTFIMFQKNNTVLKTGGNNFELWSDLVGNNKVELNITLDEAVHLYWAVIPENPLGDVPIPSAIPDYPLYIDVYGNFTGQPPFTPNITISYDPAQLNGVPEDDLVLYWADISDIDDPSWEIMDEFIIDPARNELIANITNEPHFFALGTKDMTDTVNWSVKEGDEIYVGMNGEGYGRATVTTINITTYNMTEIIPIRIPGLPEMMNFSTVYANLAEWDGNSWETEPYESLIAAANNYMPMFPGFFGGEGGFISIFLPNGTTGEDLKPVLGFFGMMYFDQVWGHDYIILSDPFSEAYIKVNFTVEDGRITFFRGWFPGEEDDSEYVSFYTLNMTIFDASPIEDFYLYPELVDPDIWKVDLNMTFDDSEDLHFGWAVLPDNPTNSTLWNFLPENISIYIHVFVNDTDSIVGGNFSLYFDKDILKACGLNESDLVPYVYNFEYSYWEPVPESSWDLDKDNNRLIVTPEGGAVFTIGTSMLSQVDWHYEEGDILYIGMMEGEMKLQIHEINVSSIYNMTELTGVDMEIFGFPDNQTFSNVYADIWFWEETDGIWDWEYDKLMLAAAANNYWPFAPIEYFVDHGNEMGIPFIMPEETTGEDMAYIMEVFMEDMMFDTIASGTEFVYTSNSSNSYYMKIYVNSETGIARNIYGHFYHDHEWHYFSYFFKYNETKPTGGHNFDLDNSLVPDIEMEVEIECSGGFDFLYAVLSANPTDKPIAIGTPIIYFDIMVINKSKSEFNMTWTFEFSPKYDVRYVSYLYRWVYDVDYPEYRVWGYSSLSYYESIGILTRDFAENSITITMYSDYEDGSIQYLWALSYTPPPGAAPSSGGGGGDGDDDKEVVIPGYDIYILLMIFSLISIIVIIQRRKKIRI